MTNREQLFYPARSNNDNSSTANLFEARTFFREFTIPYVSKELHASVNQNTSPEKLRIKNFIPFGDLYKENSFYGIIDHEGDAVIPINDMKNFSSVGYDKNGKELFLQNFVAAALNDMVEYLNKQILGSCYELAGIPDVARTSPFYNLKVKKAYTKSTDINTLYNAGARVIANKFKAKVLDDKKLDSKIDGYETFNKEYIPFLKKHLFVSPVTKSRITCFYNFITFSNGLMFSFSDEEAGNEEKMYTKYYLDPGFRNFADACKRFGFVIDKNNPFILHIDLSSPALNDYYYRFSLAGPADMFKKRFKKVFHEDLTALKYFFIDSYNEFIIDNSWYTPDLSSFCASEAKSIGFKTRERIIKNIGIKTREKVFESEYPEYSKKFPDTYWMRLYVYFKSQELNMGLTQEKFEGIVRTVNNYVKFGKTDQALKIVNSMFNELSGVKYFEDLQRKNEVVEQSVSSAGEEINF